VSAAPGRLAGRAVLVAGAAGGIGAAVAQALADDGARLALCDLGAKSADTAQLAEHVGAAGPGATVIPVDLASVDSIRSCVATAAERMGRLDVVVNCTGTIIRKRSVDLRPEEWDTVLGLNLRGAFFLAQAAARVMITQGGGKVISLASTLGLVGSRERASYAASKGGLVNLTRALAVEWAPHNIQVNAVAPTFVATPLTAGLFKSRARLNEVLRQTPARRLARPEEVAAAVVYLASREADMVTGITLPVDGGWTAL